MKKALNLNLALGLALVLAPGCTYHVQPTPAVVQAPAPVYQETSRPAPATAASPQTTAYVYDQKPMGTKPALVAPDQAQATINRFKEAYPKLGSPRLLIYVNRELVDEHSGMKLIRRNEHVESARGFDATNAAASSIKSSSDNTYRPDEKAQPTLADKQTVRDIERLFGRPLRAAGASLVDQKVAAELIADRPLDEFIGTTDTPQARKDREALSQIADAVIEILISSKAMTVPAISGDQTVTVADIQATAINLKDSKILGQVSSSDVLARVPPATVGGFDVREVSEATALALMDDIAPETK